MLASTPVYPQMIAGVLFMIRALFCVVILLCSACAVQSVNPFPGIAGEDVTVSMMHDDTERSFVLHLPTGYDGSQELPRLHVSRAL